MGRRVRTRDVWRAVLLCVVLLVPGTPELLAREAATERAARAAVSTLGASAGFVGANRLPEAAPLAQIAPPPPSGADPP